MRVAFFAVLLLSNMLADRAGFADLPNILWVNAEDMSPHLGCYGHPDAITPNIDRLATEGIVYRNAFATAPICSPSRSCLATGLYATSTGTQHLRCEVQIPSRVVPLASRLKELGYFCTNTGKSDYNFNPDGIWDAWNNDPAPWRKRREGQPFFSFITVGETHEGRINTPEKYQQAIASLPDELRHDPATVSLPPFYPDTPEIRSIFAGMYDLATVFDQRIGEIVDQLKEDQDLENTVIFVFGDHGNGLPRYKRWLNDSGLRVPLVVYVPPKFRNLSPVAAGSATNRLVSFVDFPATAISLAGAKVPSLLHGKPFLGTSIAKPRRFVFGARSRADDMFEVSRSVSDGRYFYARHFMPHLPYIQDSVIFADRKSSMRELRRLHKAGELNQHASSLWASHKPNEELYDLKNDPHELHNLANDPQHAKRKAALAHALKQWILDHRDSGLLTEAEYQIRASKAGATPFDVVQDPASFDLRATVDAAFRVGDGNYSAADLSDGLSNQESGARYWSVVAAIDRIARAGGENEGELAAFVAPLARALDDTSPSVAIAASEAILRTNATGGQRAAALKRLEAMLQDERPWVSLEAASTAARLGNRCKAMVPAMKAVVNRNRSASGSKRPYRDFNYASFTGWALETALTACGEDEFVASIGQ